MRGTCILAGLAAALVGCAAAAPTPDRSCLDRLRARGVAFTEGPEVEGIRTPVTLDGDRFTPRLAARGSRPPHMDCRLAEALVAARPIFGTLGITELEYSAAYHYRNRRRSNKLSAHAFGLAIDVHTVRGPDRDYVVARNFERRSGRWKTSAYGPGWYQSCVGRPRTAGGKVLRRLSCRLRLEESFRLILTPDDDRDHRDHFHLEARDSPPAG